MPVQDGTASVCWAVPLALALCSSGRLHATSPQSNDLLVDHRISKENMTHYHTITVNGLRVFYRAAGAEELPVLLLLHGFPASSFMFRELIDKLSDRFRVIAPDYPGFGYS